jgi:hypothetical protein
MVAVVCLYRPGGVVVFHHGHELAGRLLESQRGCDGGGRRLEGARGCCERPDKDWDRRAARDDKGGSGGLRRTGAAEGRGLAGAAWLRLGID